MESSLDLLFSTHSFSSLNGLTTSIRIGLPSLLSFSGRRSDLESPIFDLKSPAVFGSPHESSWAFMSLHKSSEVFGSLHQSSAAPSCSLSRASQTLRRISSGINLNQSSRAVIKTLEARSTPAGNATEIMTRARDEIESDRLAGNSHSAAQAPSPKPRPSSPSDHDVRLANGD